jgi:hypothetical protein
VLVVSAMLATGAAGCQTVERHPEAAIGAGAGAAGGAVLGGLAGGTRGAVIGGLLGALAGGATGEYLSRRDRTRTEAANVVNYAPAQGPLVTIESAQAAPRTVRPGEQVNLSARYTILTPQPDEQISVRERRVVRYQGEMVANPEAEFVRPNGTFTSALPIVLPQAAAPGTYEVTTTVVAAGRSSTEQTTFTVQ